MRPLLTCLPAGGDGPAPAMNRGGHDGWLSGGLARSYRQAVPHAHGLLPQRQAFFGETRKRVANPCERIRLEGSDCHAPEEEREAGR